MTSPERVANQLDVVSFWQSAGRERWFATDDTFDARCRARFAPTYEAARAERLTSWEQDATGALALVILLDQIPRNIFRGSPATWATDALALAIARRAKDRGFDEQVAAAMREVFYLPFMHAERLDAQDVSVRLYETLGNPDALDYARHHREVIARFGRFPHRNHVLGRRSTPEERAFLGRDDFRG